MHARTKVTVRYAETDRMGIVHHSNYPIWYEIARNDYIKMFGISYTDMENAEFYEDEYSTFYVWYYDGVNRYLLGNDYTIGDDGLAYHDEDGLVYPAGWIPEEPYDPAVDWGANWMDN